MHLRPLPLDDLTIDDERSFRHVALYDELKQALRRDGYRFRVPSAGSPALPWDRALFLNLTFWDAGDSGDVLVDDHIAADVVAHVAWHHLTRRALLGAGADAAASADGLLLGESIASAFDLYLVGRLLGHAPTSEFLETQVPAMAEAAVGAGLSEEDFAALLREIATDPDRAFEDLRALLFDVTTTLVRCSGIVDAADALETFEERRFAPLLHHYELSNWILYARARARSSTTGRALDPHPSVRAVDEALRGADVALAWLEEHWIRPLRPI